MSVIFKPLFVFLGSLGALLLGFIFLDINIGNWLGALAKPALMPSGGLFMFICAVMYILAGVACTIVWFKNPQNSHTEGWVRYYFMGVLFNAGLLVFFFGFHALTISLIDTLLLIFTWGGLAVSGYEIDKKATWLILPSVLWLAFCAYLIIGIWLLN